MIQPAILALIIASEPSQLTSSDRLGLAAAALVVGAVLLAIEFFIASMGLLAVAAAACAILAVVLGFQVSVVWGFAFLLAVPVIATVVVRWGMQRLQRSSLVPQEEIRDEAGYHHAADRFGIGLGARGEMVTDAYPTGRARFALPGKPAGELDVAVRGGSAERGDLVQVVAIDGAVLNVATLSKPASSERNP